MNSYAIAISLLKNREVFSVGLMESIFNGVLNIYLFAWTPILQNSVRNSEINVGIIFNCFVLSMITGTMLYEVIIIMKSRYVLFT